AKPTEKYLKEVKRIFHYLRGIVNTGLWYNIHTVKRSYGIEGSDDGVTTSFQRSQNSRPHAQIIKDTFKMKAQLSPQPSRAKSTADQVHSRAIASAVAAETQPKDFRILVINFGKSPSEFNHPIENPFEINLLEINFRKSPVSDCFLNVLSHLGYEFLYVMLIVLVQMSADIARSHGSDGRGEDRLLHTMYPAVAWVALLTEFELRDKQSVMPLGDHVAHWSSYIGEIIKGVPLYYTSWLKVLKEQKAALITDNGTQFNLRPHMESPDWTEINADIQQHLQKTYNTNKAAFKAQHWVIDPTTGTYNVEKIGRACPKNITASEWDKGGKQRGHIPGVGRVLPARATTSPSTPAHESTLNSLHKKVNFMMSLFKSDSKYSDMFLQFESGGASGSGGCVDNEEGADDQDDKDEDGDGDT
nr:F-box domain, leucine-rich repeat domain, L domain-like protein [Tanacetum cinerariifolium]